MLQFLINGVVDGVVLSVITLGFSLVYFTSRIFHIAYAFLFVLGGYTLYSFYTHLAIPLLPSIGLTIIVCAFFSWFIDKFFYQNFEKKGATHNILLIASLGIFIIGINSLAYFFGPGQVILSKDLSESILIAGQIITHNKITQLTTCMFTIILVLVLLYKTNIGLMIRAFRDNAKLMGILGYNTKNVRGRVFILSGILIAIPACLLSFDKGVDPYLGMPVFLNAVVAMIIGGTGDFKAPIIGAFILSLSQAIVIYFLDAKWEPLVTFVILIIFLLFLPSGIFKQTEREI